MLSLVEAIAEMGNPFLDQSDELLTLDLANVMDQSVVETVRTIEALGKEQFQSYYKSVLVDCTTSIHEPIKRNNLPLFKRPKLNQKPKQSRVIENLKMMCLFFHDCTLWQRTGIVICPHFSNMKT